MCGNRKQPTGPEQVKMLIDNRLSQITGVPAKAFNGRITIGLVEPQNVKMVKSFGDYDLMKRADFLEFGKTILASMKQTLSQNYSVRVGINCSFALDKV